MSPNPWRSWYPLHEPRRRDSLTHLLEHLFDEPARFDRSPEALQSTGWLPLNVSETEKDFTIVGKEVEGYPEGFVKVPITDRF